MSNEHKVSRRIILHCNGDPIHFDVEVDFMKIALNLAPRAEKQNTWSGGDRQATAIFGAVKVKLIR